MTIPTLILSIICLLISIIATYLVIQWANEIQKRNHALDTQTKLLSLMAEKQGVSQKEIEKLLAREQAPNPTKTNLLIILLLLTVVLGIIIAANIKT